MSEVKVEALLKRIFMFLEDGEWNSANEYCERVLDIEPENPYAYLGKLMAELHVNTKENLSNCTKSFEESTNYKKLMRYSDCALGNEIKNYAIDAKQNFQDATKKKRKQKVAVFSFLCIVLVAAILIIPATIKSQKQKTQTAVVDALIGTAYRDWFGTDNQIAGIYHFVDSEAYEYISINTADGNILEESGTWKVVAVEDNIMEIQVKSYRQNASWKSMYVWFQNEDGIITVESVRVKESTYIEIPDSLYSDLFS